MPDKNIHSPIFREVLYWFILYRIVVCDLRCNWDYEQIMGGTIAIYENKE
jgi:hypothetical protein